MRAQCRGVRFLLLLAVLGGCNIAQEDALNAGDDSGAPATECAMAADCVLASSSCCGCPEFAMPDQGWVDGCEVVECPPPEDDAPCGAVTADCVSGVCTVACQPVTCELSCEGGFAVDATGCQVCACAGGSDAPQCTLDTDCVAVAADCCGCARGGADTAVPAGEVGLHDDRLDCPSDPGESACPEVDVCDPSATARCVGGQCTLGAGGAPSDPALACGRPDLPPCPEGSACVLNSDPEAAMQGLGTCQEE